MTDKPSLFSAIMNLPCTVPAGYPFGSELCSGVYRQGHQAARHAAAELVLGQASTASAGVTPVAYTDPLYLSVKQLGGRFSATYEPDPIFNVPLYAALSAAAPNEKGGSHAVRSALRADVVPEGRDSVTNARESAGGMPRISAYSYPGEAVCANCGKTWDDHSMDDCLNGKTRFRLAGEGTNANSKEATGRERLLERALVYSAFAQHSTERYMLPKGITLLGGPNGVEVTLPTGEKVKAMDDSANANSLNLGSSAGKE